MKLKKAIETVEKWYAGGYATRIEDMNPALKILIEAGKGIIAWRVDFDDNLLISLPGETED